MSIAKSLLGFRKFWNEHQIRGLITKSKNFDSQQESPDVSNCLLLFETSKQRTWIVSTSIRLYCVLDDIRKDRPRLQWSVAKSELADGTDYLQSINVKPKSDRTGLVDIGTKHKNWLYSKKLFTSSEVDSQISNLLSDT